MKNYLLLFALIAAALCGCKKDVVVEDNIEFEDLNFKSALLQLTVDGTTEGKKIDANGNGEISVDEAAAVTSITINTSTAGIKSMKEIEYFRNITYLDCSGSVVEEDDDEDDESDKVDVERLGIKQLDLLQNVKLRELYCAYNKLNYLNLDECYSLRKLNCSHNESLTEIDLYNCRQIEEIDCSFNALSSLDLYNNTKLTTLNCSKNELYKLDLSTNVGLLYLYCESLHIYNLDVTKLPDLIKLYCSHNWGIMTLDLSQNRKLIKLVCYDCLHLWAIYIAHGQRITEMSYPITASVIEK